MDAMFFILPLIIVFAICGTIAFAFSKVASIAKRDREAANDIFGKDSPFGAGSSAKQIIDSINESMNVKVAKDQNGSVTISTSSGDPKIIVNKTTINADGQPGKNIFEGFGIKVERDANGTVIVNRNGTAASASASETVLPATRCTACGATIGEGEKKCQYCDSPRIPS